MTNMFSVWGKGSKQREQQNKDLTNFIDIAEIRPTNTAEVGNRNKRGMFNVNKVFNTFGLDGTEPNQDLATHMQLVENIVNDGSIRDMIFSNKSLTTAYLNQTKSGATPIIEPQEDGGIDLMP